MPTDGLTAEDLELPSGRLPIARIAQPTPSDFISPPKARRFSSWIADIGDAMWLAQICSTRASPTVSCGFAAPDIATS